MRVFNFKPLIMLFVCLWFGWCMLGAFTVRDSGVGLIIWILSVLITLVLGDWIEYKLTGKEKE